MIRLAIRCRAEDADHVLAELLELVPGGVEEVGPVNPPDAPGREAEAATGWFEYAIYGPPGEVPELPELEATAGEGLIEVSSTEIPDDWADAWRDFHVPIAIDDGRITVRPSWFDTEPASDPAAPGREAEEAAGIGSKEAAGIGSEQPSGVVVTIDPGQAFGTGAHATTRLCLELLLGLADTGEARGPLADLGTGSGVLAIAAAKLGFAPVLACDSEQASIDAAGTNAAANGVELELERRNLRTEPPPAAPTIVANLTAPLLRDVAAGLAGRTVPRRLVCSGLLASELDGVVAAFTPLGLIVAESRVSGDWAGILFAMA